MTGSSKIFGSLAFYHKQASSALLANQLTSTNELKNKSYNEGGSRLDN